MTIKLDGVFNEPGNRLVLTCEVYTCVQVLCSQSSRHIHFDAIILSHSFAKVSLRVWEYNQTKRKELKTSTALQNFSMHGGNTKNYKLNL
jgi:hypothetical protein